MMRSVRIRNIITKKKKKNERVFLIFLIFFFKKVKTSYRYKSKILLRGMNKDLFSSIDFLRLTNEKKLLKSHS